MAHCGRSRVLVLEPASADLTRFLVDPRYNLVARMQITSDNVHARLLSRQTLVANTKPSLPAPRSRRRYPIRPPSLRSAALPSEELTRRHNAGTHPNLASASADPAPPVTHSSISAIGGFVGKDEIFVPQWRDKLAATSQDVEAALHRHRPLAEDHLSDVSKQVYNVALSNRREWQGPECSLL